MSFYAAQLLAHRANDRIARRYARMLIAGSPAPYMVTLTARAAS
jgi:hypothetical protein